MTLSVTLSGGALFASWKLLQFPSSLIVKVILAIFTQEPERFPAGCVSTQEPMLVSAVIVQKGKQWVQRANPSVKSKIEEIPVATAKVLVYRDQVEGPWKDFQEGPLKYIVNCLKILAVCRKPGCMCESWHVGESQSEPLIDVWNRDFLTLGFKKSKPSESELFACAIRVRQEVFDDVMKQSGKSGIYIEPRSDDGKSHGDKYHTVWLSKMAFNEAVVACAKAKTPAYLIRVNRRYGLKTKVEFANELHKQFRADEPMMQGPTNTIYTVGPLPWGTTRKSLQALFNQWGWQARALQPAGRSADGKGLLWNALASVPPGTSVVQMEHGDIIIVRKDIPQAVSQAVPAVEASTHTRQSLQGVNTQQKFEDPWAEAASRLPCMRAESSVSPIQIQQIEKSLEEKLTKKMATEDVLMDHTWEPRVKDLEEKLARISEVQQQQASQTDRLTTQVQCVQSQMEKQSQEFRTHLDAKLESQMSKIEALLTKRARQEWSRGCKEGFRGFRCKPGPILTLILWLVTVFGQLRVGEASNPGPWGLGAVNPTGLASKASFFEHFDPGVYAVSETHLTNSSIARFRGELKSSKVPFELKHGPPAPTKSDSWSSTGGRHTGVGFLSSFPSRSVMGTWDQSVVESVRAYAAHFLIQQTWITGGVVYGAANQSQSKSVQEYTNSLIEEVAKFVTSQPGPKFIAGDFNQHPGVLDAMDKLESQGWVELQDLAFRRWAINPAMTCKGKSRKDFVYISGELQSVVQSVAVINDIFPDHAALVAKMNDLSSIEPIPMWYIPTRITKDQKVMQQVRDDIEPAPVWHQVNPTEAYQQLWKSFEARVDAACDSLGQPRLTNRNKGRAATLRREFIQNKVGPIKAARHGEPNPNFSGLNLQLKRWFGQWRRLINLARLMQKQDLTLSAKQHSKALTVMESNHHCTRFSSVVFRVVVAEVNFHSGVS